MVGSHGQERRCSQASCRLATTRHAWRFCNRPRLAGRGEAARITYNVVLPTRLGRCFRWPRGGVWTISFVVEIQAKAELREVSCFLVILIVDCLMYALSMLVLLRYAILCELSISSFTCESTENE